jgi:hypothetical protein
LDARHFKSYEELKKKLDAVLSGTAAPVRQAAAVDLDDAPVRTESAPVSRPAPVAPAAVSLDDDDDTLSYFANLAADD